MQVILHCGLDKAGSTAIQAHLSLYREWFGEQGVYVPRSGLSGFGHVDLFKDLGDDNWRSLVEELAGLECENYRFCFLSYEGIRAFDPEQILRIRELLKDYPVTPLFYLREQAEIIQSGYLQRLKSAPARFSLAELNSDHSLLCHPGRDYCRLLQAFESVFGAGSLAVRRYHPADWRDHSIVWDLLSFLGCEPGDEFTVSSQKQNTSLDLEGAKLLNAFDSYGENSAGRKALVEDLLWLTERYPGGEKYLLEEAAVGEVRAFYREANAVLFSQFGIEFDYTPCWVGAGRDGGARCGPAFVDELARLSAYPRWHGEELSGAALSTLLGRSSGWSRFENWGVWTVGRESVIEFRLPRARFAGLEQDFVVVFSGRYFSDIQSTQLWLHGELLQEIDLRHVSLRIPLSALDQDRVIRLVLRHPGALSPADLGTGDDARKLAFGLHAISYSLAPH